MQHLILVGILFTMFTKPAHAYLDPGTGSFLLQVIIGGFLGGIFIIKGYWQRIVTFFTKKKPNQPSASTEDEE